MGHIGSKKPKPIPIWPRGAGLKSRLIPDPPPLRGGEKPTWREAGRDGAKLPSQIFCCHILHYMQFLTILVDYELHKKLTSYFFFSFLKKTPTIFLNNMISHINIKECSFSLLFFQSTTCWLLKSFICII